jgi:hypothetical protein
MDRGQRIEDGGEPQAEGGELVTDRGPWTLDL